MSKFRICSLIIILFHIVGLYGFLVPELNALFTRLVPLHLLLMLTLMVISGNDGSMQLKLFAAGVYLAGFLVEVVGTNTSLIFGSYEYGDTLGYKLWRTPLLIGVNWLLLVYATGVMLDKFKATKYIKASLGAAILVGIDYILEPVAVRFDYWSWSEKVIPLQNYFGWFIVSFMMFIFFQSLEFKKQNSSAIVLFVAQVFFFIVLNKWTT